MQRRVACCLAAAGLINAGCAGAQPPVGIGEDREVAEQRDSRPSVTDEPATGMEDLALRTASEHLSVPIGELEILRLEAVDWRDSSLGCPQPGRAYMQVITPGHYAVVGHDDATWRVHMAGGRAFVCEQRAGDKLLLPEVGVQKLKLPLDKLETLAKMDLARKLGVAVEDITVSGSQPVRWSDASLGCPDPGATEIAAESDGYIINLSYRDREYSYHTDLRRVIPCPPIESQ